jgi:Protein of unknown function (DUF2726)
MEWIIVFFILVLVLSIFIKPLLRKKYRCRQRDTLSTIVERLFIGILELEDKSHKQKKSMARDALLEHACMSAGLTLVRFEAKWSYQVQAIREQIDTEVNSAKLPC